MFLPAIFPLPRIDMLGHAAKPFPKRFPKVIAASKASVDRILGKATPAKDPPMGFAEFSYKVGDASFGVIFTKNLQKSVFVAVSFKEPRQDWRRMVARLGLQANGPLTISSGIRGNVRYQVKPFEGLPANWVVTAITYDLVKEAHDAVSLTGFFKAPKVSYVSLYDATVNLP